MNIRNAKTEKLVAEVTELTEETITVAVTIALQERLTRLRRQSMSRRLADELNEIALHCAALPVYDDRSADEIVGFDERGLPS